MLYSRALFLIVALTLAACDAQGPQEDFVDRASRPPVGITRTDETGRVIDADPDDWSVAPLYEGTVRIDPAYPNPSPGGFIAVPVTITQFGSIRGQLILRAYNSRGILERLGQIPADSPGTFTFTFATGLLPSTGLHRLFIFDSGGELISYGDVQIE